MIDIANLLFNCGVAVVVIAFFMYKDLKFMATLNNTLKALEDSVNLIRNHFIKEKKHEDNEDE